MESINVLKSQIRSSMTLKTTEELVEIWKTNNRLEWSVDALEVIKDLLLERLGTLPEQNELIEDKVGIKDLSKKLLEDYETKSRLFLLLDFGLYICIPFTAMTVIATVIFLISIINPESNISVSGSIPWYFIVCTLSIAPIFILRKRAKSALETIKSDIREIIGKGLEKT